MLAFLLSITEKEAQDKVEDLYNRFNDEMLKLARSRLGGGGVKNCDEDAQDIVQNAWLRAMIYADRIDVTRSDKEVKGYMMAIVTNLCNTYFKKEKEKECCEYFDELYEGDDLDYFASLNIEARYEDVKRAVNQLDEIYLTAFIYYYFVGMKAKDIATLFEVPLKTMESRIARGRAQVLASLGVERKKGVKKNGKDES